MPLEFKVRGGRKEIILPAGVEAAPKAQPQRALVLALARAYKRQKMLGGGEVGSMEELAARYGVDRSYVGRTLRLASLAPRIFEAVVVADESDGLALDRLKKPFPSEWDRQRAMMGF